MSFSNILSGDAPEPPKPTPRAAPASKPAKSTVSTPNGDAKPTSAASRRSLAKAGASKGTPGTAKGSSKLDAGASGSLRGGTGTKRKPIASSEKENEKVKAEMAKIDAMEMSDIDSPAWDDAKQKYQTMKRKRQEELEKAESMKRKVRASIASAFQRFL